MCRNVFSIFAFLAIFHSHQFIHVLGSGLTDYAKGFELITALKFGDECSWEAEQFHLNYTWEKITSLSTGDDAETNATAFLESIIKRNYSLCSAPELYICDKESQKCVCGDVSYEALYKPKRSLYTLEDGNKCRRKLNTYCLSYDELDQDSNSLIMYDSNCKTGTICTIREGEPCSTTNMAEYILRNGGISAFPTPQTFMEEMLAGKVCTCKADQVKGEGNTDTPNSKDDTMKKEGMDGNHVSGNGGRWRRHISENTELDNVLAGYVGGVGPTLFRV